MNKLIKLASVGIVAAAVLGVTGCYCKGKNEAYRVTPVIMKEPVVVEHHHHKLEKVKHEHVHK